MSCAALELDIGVVIAASVDEGRAEVFKLGECLAVNCLVPAPAVEVVCSDAGGAFFSSYILCCDFCCCEDDGEEISWGNAFGSRADEGMDGIFTPWCTSNCWFDASLGSCIPIRPITSSRCGSRAAGTTPLLRIEDCWCRKGGAPACPIWTMPAGLL